MNAHARIVLAAALCAGLAACCCGLPTSTPSTASPTSTPPQPFWPPGHGFPIVNGPVAPPGFQPVGAAGWTMSLPPSWQQRPPPAGPRPGSNYELHAFDSVPQGGFVANVMVMHRNDPAHGIVVARSGPATAGMFAQQGTVVAHHGPTRLGGLEAYEIETQTTTPDGTSLGSLMTLAVNGPHYFTITCTGASAAWAQVRATCVTIQQSFRAQ